MSGSFAIRVSWLARGGKRGGAARDHQPRSRLEIEVAERLVPAWTSWGWFSPRKRSLPWLECREGRWRRTVALERIWLGWWLKRGGNLRAPPFLLLRPSPRPEVSRPLQDRTPRAQKRFPRMAPELSAMRDHGDSSAALWKVMAESSETGGTPGLVSGKSAEKKDPPFEQSVAFPPAAFLTLHLFV